MGVHCETQIEQDFGPTLLLPLKIKEASSDAADVDPFVLPQDA